MPLASHPRTLAASALIAVTTLTGCVATRLPQPVTGYTCCNLRAESGWISSTNVQAGPMLPAGQTAVIDTVKRGKYFYGTIGDDAIGMRDDSAWSQEDALRWVRQIVVSSDPKAQLASWAPEVQKAVHSARVRIGMTRSQVSMSLGYPSREDTKDLSANTWRYWTEEDDEPVGIRFGADGTVNGFEGKPSAVRAIESAN